MAWSLPDSYRRLGQYARRFPGGSRIYGQGAVPEECYVVFKGRVHFQVVGDDGSPRTVAVAGAGDPVGHVAFFTGRPTSATAIAAEDTVILAFDRDALPAVFERAPDLAIDLIDAFARPDELARRQQEALAGMPHDAVPAPADEPVTFTLDAPFDGATFFLDSTTCPVSGTQFEYLRVRTSAVRPASRDSDFLIRYKTVDPTHYAIVVCPGCGYASAHDDFAEIDTDERAQLWTRRSERLALLSHPLTGVRDADDVVASIELALRSYALRRPNERRRAALLHRRAWVERLRENEAAERDYLSHARDAYQHAYENDTDISDEGAMRTAYLIGDLTLRLGDPLAGARWLAAATRYPQAQNLTGLARVARERLADARELLNDLQQAAS
jgi:uncharacterized protein